MPLDWLDKPLHELSVDQWESLCDGCGKCCMAKLQDAESNKVYYTNIACELFDAERCRCTDYSARTQKVAGCVSLSLDRLYEFEWLPSTCAYRLRLNGQPLPDWHPLKSKDNESVHAAGISMRGKSVHFEQAGPIEHHIIDWK